MSLSRPILQYPEDKLTQALDAIRNGMSIREASRNFGVPRGTIQDRLHLRVPEGPRKMGPDSILNKLEEAEIAIWLKDIATCGFGKKPDNLFNTVQDMMIEDGRPNPFVNGRPGKKWMNSFFKRNNMFSMRTPEAISKGRAVITEESVRKWFVKLTDYLTKNQALDVLEDPKRILNGDETSFMLCPKTGKVIAPRGYKNVYQIVKGKEKEAVTVLAFFSAMGDILPPCVVFPYIRPPKDVINSMPDGWFLGKSDTGWMKADIFYDYISKCLSKWIDDNKVKKPVLVFVDGHKTHMTMKLSKNCHDNNIILYALPPNTTHLMQPADVSVFKPLKSEWAKTVHDWCSQPQNANTVLTKSSFCPLLKKVLSKESLKESIKNGFRKCGLFPFDPSAVDYSKCVQNTLEKKNASTSKITSPSSLKKGVFNIALKVIRHLGNDLTARGVNVSVVLEIIENAKLVERLNNSVSNSTTEREVKDNEQSVIVEEKTELGLKVTNANKETEKNGAKELYVIRTEEENKYQKETEIDCDRTRIDNKKDDESRINTSQCEILDIDTSTSNNLVLSDLTFLNNYLLDDDIQVSTFEDNDNSILVPIGDNSPISRSEYTCHPKPDSVIQIRSPRVSPFVRKHLIIPSPIKKSTTPRVMNRIGAISSEEWRQFEILKEEEKQKKKDAIEERKLQRQKNKEEKQKQRNENKKNKAVNSTKRKMKRLTTKKKDDDSDPEFIVKTTKKRKLNDMIDIAEEAKQTSCDYVEAKPNMIKILSDILITPETPVKESNKENVLLKKKINRRETFRNEEELEIFLNSDFNDE